MQDQFASSFGGLNFIEFDKNEIKVSPLKLSESSLENFRKFILLFYTGASRDSADILSEQKKATKELDDKVIKSLQKIKEAAYVMKGLLEKGDIVEFGKMLHKSWIEKKNISAKISNPYIDKCYQIAMEQKALGGKVTGAGGGGFLMFICEPKNQEKLREALIEQGLKELKFNFETEGTCVILEQHYYNRKLITPDGYLVAINSIVKKFDRNMIQEIIDIIMEAYRKNKQIFIFGNGGSAATSSHFACDLNKTVSIKGKPLFKAISLTDNVSLMTAWGNDTSFDNIFYGQMLNFFNKGDVALGISGGGNSPSVLKALQYANEMDSPSIALTGFNGGKVKDIAKTVLIVPVHNYQLIEDVHVILIHLIASVIKETLTN